MKNYIAEYMKDNYLKIGVEFKIKGYSCWFRFPNTSYLQNKNGVGEWENSRANDVTIAKLLRGEKMVERSSLKIYKKIESNLDMINVYTFEELASDVRQCILNKIIAILNNEFERFPNDEAIRDYLSVKKFRFTKEGKRIVSFSKEKFEK